MSFEELSKLIKQKAVLQKDIRTSSYICHLAQDIIAQLYPGEKFKIVSFKNGCIKVATQSLALNSEITGQQKKIIEKINQKNTFVLEKVEKIQTVLKQSLER